MYRRMCTDRLRILSREICRVKIPEDCEESDLSGKNIPEDCEESDLLGENIPEDCAG